MRSVLIRTVQWFNGWEFTALHYTTTIIAFWNQHYFFRLNQRLNLRRKKKQKNHLLPIDRKQTIWCEHLIEKNSFPKAHRNDATGAILYHKLLALFNCFPYMQYVHTSTRGSQSMTFAANTGK